MTKNYSKGNIKQLFVSYNGIYSRIIKCTGHLLKIEDFQLLNDLVIFTTPRWGVGSCKSSLRNWLDWENNYYFIVSQPFLHRSITSDTLCSTFETS